MFSLGRFPRISRITVRESHTAIALRDPYAIFQIMVVPFFGILVFDLKETLPKDLANRWIIRVSAYLQIRSMRKYIAL